MNKPFMESPSINGQLVRLGVMQKNMVRMKGKEDRVLHEIKVNRLKQEIASELTEKFPQT